MFNIKTCKFDYLGREETAEAAETTAPKKKKDDLFFKESRRLPRRRLPSLCIHMCVSGPAAWPRSLSPQRVIKLAEEGSWLAAALPERTKLKSSLIYFRRWLASLDVNHLTGHYPRLQ
jgi:hypothetical protein